MQNEASRPTVDDGVDADRNAIASRFGRRLLVAPARVHPQRHRSQNPGARRRALHDADKLWINVHWPLGPFG